MDPIQFAKKMKDAAPSELDLSKCGLSATEAKAFVHSFLCVPRGDARLRDWFSDPLLDLVQNWEVSRIEIGMVCFRNHPVVLNGDYCVGSVESDPMVICRESGEVVVKSAFHPWQVLWVAAKDGSGFLDALSIAAEYLGRRAVELVKFDDAKSARLAASACSDAAGGNRYLEFYMMLLGAESNDIGGPPKD